MLDSIFLRSCRIKISDQMNFLKLSGSCWPMSFWRTNAIRRGSFWRIQRSESPITSVYSLERFPWNLADFSLKTKHGNYLNTIISIYFSLKAEIPLIEFFCLINSRRSFVFEGFFVEPSAFLSFSSIASCFRYKWRSNELLTIFYVCSNSLSSHCTMSPHYLFV